MSYEFSISATDEAGLELLSEVGVTWPKVTFQESAQVQRLVNGHSKDFGRPIAIWQWGIINATMRDILRTYCPGRSSDVVIRTWDSELDYVNYQAIMNWPNTADRQSGRQLGLVIAFTNLVEIESS